MNPDNETRINTGNITFETPIPSISVALSVSSISIGSIVTFINVSVLVAAVKCSPKKQNAHFNLVVGLSFSDICSGLNLFVNGIRLSLSSLYSEPILCASVIMVLAMAILASVTQTFFICLNRFLLISKSNLNVKIFSNRNLCIIFVANWTIAISLVLVFVDVNSIMNLKNICNIYTVFGDNFEVFRYVYCCSCIVGVVLTILLYLVALNMLRKACRKTFVTTISVVALTERKSRNLSDTRTSRETTQNDVTVSPSSLSRETRSISQSMKTVGMILTALTCLTGPLIIVNLINTTSQPVILLTVNLAVLNSMINPLLYCKKMNILRVALRSMFCGRCSQR